MKHLITGFLLVFLTSLISVAVFIPQGNAQDRQLPSPCPVVSVSCPVNCPKPNQTVTFHANITGAPSDTTLIFSWSASTGKIIRGQGTRTVTVRAERCESMTATVSVVGFPPGCAGQASCTTSTHCCGSGMPAARKVDEFGNINCEDEMAHLDVFAVELNNKPGSTGYIIFYGGRTYNRRLARLGESEARAGRIKKYLTERRGINAGRIVLINGGYRENWTAELWIAPMGASTPAQTPTLKTRDIKFRRGKIGKREYKCAV